jgi:hypothetical protein
MQKMTDAMKKGMTTSEFLVLGLLYLKDYLDEIAALIPTISSQVAEISNQLKGVSDDNQAIYWLGALYIAGRAGLKIAAKLKEMQAEDHVAMAEAEK